ncbi:AAC(3) family N-acetyltransferase (plasmid) [Acinetobacter baumannii]
MHTRKAITEALQKLGVQTGDLLMVHASLKAIGPVEGGAETVVAALRSAVGPTGTVMGYASYGPQNDVTLKMPAFEWVHVQLHQQKGMISLSPPTICNSASLSTASNLKARKSARRPRAEARSEWFRNASQDR